jgi:hypothetical protein
VSEHVTDTSTADWLATRQHHLWRITILVQCFLPPRLAAGHLRSILPWVHGISQPEVLLLTIVTVSIPSSLQRGGHLWWLLHLRQRRWCRSQR